MGFQNFFKLISLSGILFSVSTVTVAADTNFPHTLLTDNEEPENTGESGETEPGDDPVLAEMVLISPAALRLGIKDNYQLEAVIFPHDATEKSVIWSSSNEKIVTVDQTGYLTPHDLGDAVISVLTTDGTNLSSSCDVTVTYGNLLVYITPSIVNMTVGETFQLNAIVKGFKEDDELTIEWISSNIDVATVDDEGLVTAIAEGYATINFTVVDQTFLGFSSTSRINVSDTTGIDEINDSEAAIKEIYTLEGVRVNEANLTPGIYIVRTGSGVSKYVKRSASK